MLGASEEMHVRHLEGNALNLLETVCSVVVQPVEILLRPRFGTCYYPLPVTFFASGLMIFLPLVAAFFTGALHLIPFLSIPPPVGMFGIDALARLYFLLFAIHAYRLWRRMLHMETERHSEYEGPALPIFQILPKSDSFWFTRIIWEPLFVLIVSLSLQDLFILQSSLAVYLRFVALALAMKSFAAWFKSWQFLRKLIDNRNAGPILSRLVGDEASEEELNELHLASFPKSVPPEIRAEAASSLVRAFANH